MHDTDEPIIGPYEPRPAVCREYDPRAAVVAGQIAVLVASHLPQVQVEHVGSTAVPGCAGTGIIDLMVPCLEAEQVATVKDLLDKLGFQRQEGRDPFPEDRPMRVGAWDYQDERFLLHVHVILANSPEVDDLRFSRACLRADPGLRKSYVARKRAIIDSGVTDSLVPRSRLTLSEKYRCCQPYVRDSTSTSRLFFASRTNHLDPINLQLERPSLLVGQ